MARIKGQANYASNFEVLKQAPLDSRTVVSDAGDLTKNCNVAGRRRQCLAV